MNKYFLSFFFALFSFMVSAENEKPEIYALSLEDASTCSESKTTCKLVTKKFINGLMEQLRRTEEQLIIEKDKPPKERFCS